MQYPLRIFFLETYTTSFQSSSEYGMLYYTHTTLVRNPGAARVRRAIDTAPDNCCARSLSLSNKYKNTFAKETEKRIPLAAHGRNSTVPDILSRFLLYSVV